MVMKFILIISLVSFYSFNVFASNKKICGTVDDRVLSDDTRVARGTNLGFSSGCTVTMIGKSCAISAGHCVGSLEMISFNVPLSGEKFPLRSKLEDTYFRTKDFLRYESDGSGNDWAVIRVLKNKVTGLYPGEAQGFYKVSLNKTPQKGNIVRVTGHGRDENDNYKHLSQQTSTGAIKKIGTFFKKSVIGHEVDTMGGNSGSSIVLESSEEIVGIHSHGSCKSDGGYNQGTLISKNKVLKEVIKECLDWEKTLDASL
jgi:V8-like Glu-specific endopeptidase